MTRRIAALVLIFVTSMAFAHSAPSPAPRGQWAVIVGIDDYGPNIPTLKYAVSDALNFQRMLQNVTGIPDDHIRTLATGYGTAPTSGNILAAIRGLAKQAGPHDEFWIFFAGHGADDNGISYLLPSDVHVPNFDLYGISTRKIREILSGECKASEKVLVTDCCHSGSARGFDLATDAPTGTPGSVVTLAACSVNQSAYEFPDLWDGRGGGVFTYFLIRGLAGDADANKDGVVTGAEIRQYIADRVSDAVSSRASGEQNPVVLFGASAAPDHAMTPSDPQYLQNIEIPGGGSAEQVRPLLAALRIDTRSSGNQTSNAQEYARIADTTIKHSLLSSGFVILSSGASLSGSQAGFPVFRIKADVQTSAQSTAFARGLITATATINADVIDSSGRVVASDAISGDPAAAGNELRATTAAIQNAANQLAAEFTPDIAKAIGIDLPAQSQAPEQPNSQNNDMPAPPPQ